MNILRTSLLTALCVLITASAWADTLRVGKKKDRPYTVIQDAVNAAFSGDTILIDEGTYAGFTVGKSNLTIRPAKKGKKGLVSIDASTGPGIGLIAGSAGSIVKNITVEGPTSLLAGIIVTSTSNVKVIGCQVRGGTNANGIVLTSAQNCTITRCTVKDSDQNAIILSDSSGSTVKKCKAVDSAIDGLQIVSNSVTVTDNKIIRSGRDGIVMGKVGSSSVLLCVGSLVSRNKVGDSANDAIVLTAASSQCVVQENLIRKTEYYGVVVTGGTAEHLITKNRLDDNFVGIRVGNASVLLLHKNVSKDSGNGSFYLDSASSFVSLVKNKSLRPSDDGFRISGNNHTLISNEARKSARSGGGYGCEASSSVDCLFLDNHFDSTFF